VSKTSWIVCASLAACVVVAGCSKGADGGTQPRTAEATEPVIAWREGAERAERAPISLTASDGSGLRLTSLEARSVIEAPLAFTELHLTFHNPEPRRREGRFEITLPKEAAISRFALRVAGGFQEGEVVERRRAQQVYEDFLHRKQDPALLEKDAGNEFAARVFPIEANADKEIIIAYSEELQRHAAHYQLLLSGLPKLDRLQVNVQVGSNSATGLESSTRARGASAQLSMSQRDYAPVANLEVRLPSQKSLALRNGTLVAARVAPVIDEAPATLEGLTVLFDTSASRALGFGAQIERFGALLHELAQRTGKDFDVRVVAFDQTAEELYRGPASGFGLRDKGKLLARDALGASDLAQALGFLAQSASASGHERVLLVGDGVVTAGLEGSTALREAVTRLAAHGVRRLDVVAEGGIQDRATLAVLTHAGLAQSGVVLDATDSVAQLANRLLSATRERVEVKISGATWVYPPVLEGVQPGDERLVFAEVPVGVPVQIELVGAGSQALETLEVPRPLLARALARAKIEALSAVLRALPDSAADQRAQLEREIVSLSVEQRVVSDYTALLVLETAEDYRRYGIEQQSLTSILRVGQDGLELFDRKTREPPMIAKGEPEDLRAAPEPAEAERERDGAEGAAPAAEPAQPVVREAKQESVRKGASRRAETAERDELRRSDSAPGVGAANEAVAPPAAPAASVAPSAPAPRRASAAPSDFADDKADAPRASGRRSSPVNDALGALSGGGASQSQALGIASGAVARTARPMASSGEAPAGQPVQIAVAAPAPPAPLSARAVVQLIAANGLASAQASSVLRGTLSARARQCYRSAEPRVTPERLVFELQLSGAGTVTDATIVTGALADRTAQACIVTALHVLQFPKLEAATASLRGSLELSLQPAVVPVVSSVPTVRPQPRAAAPAQLALARPAIDEAYTGVLAQVLTALAASDTEGALRAAVQAHAQDPGDVIALVALGEVHEARREFERAARVYGSLIDLFPSRADIRRMAGGRLERLPLAQQTLAVDTYRRAVQQRPDQPAGHRALAYALFKQGDRAAAFETIDRALDRGFGSDRFAEVDRILREDLALLGTAWLHAEPAALGRVSSALAARGLEADAKPSTRFVLSWETDANDVDFHLYDGHGGHAYYVNKQLGSGGSLYADITTGYGPECFAIRGRARAYPYVLQAHYFARGPMGYGMGKVQVVEHDGKGGLLFEEHPFVIMKDKAFVELGRIARPLSG